ncbi:PilZ domain-containing protein [Rummeliibacillus sp. SL167]|uniref:PilZ domain-containing protein n=1 Tax=Rummeliibacillus sp. SL167 TaxID=2579792 RepID=UPI0011B550CA|nr:PilZ domain-containing protein [Rummeliibacillus sp. SL167]
MKYKRKESFRHVFERNVTVEYKVFSEQGKGKSEFCRLVDLSPSGAKIAMPMNLPVEKQTFQIELDFVLYAKPISVKGTVKWKLTQNGGYLYGIDLEENEVVEELIISELKLRRRQEVKENN